MSERNELQDLCDLLAEAIEHIKEDIEEHGSVGYGAALYAMDAMAHYEEISKRWK